VSVDSIDASRLKELAASAPELLFIESAWRGKDELWGNKVGHTSSELQGIVEWCRRRKIPTVFWNKEDPVHFETFLNTARLFDYVFTTDIDCIHRYKAALGHERVFLLPFACQPKIHNPIEKYERKDAFASPVLRPLPGRTRIWRILSRSSGIRRWRSMIAITARTIQIIRFNLINPTSLAHSLCRDRQGLQPATRSTSIR
jgi:hypothetical protein